MLREARLKGHALVCMRETKPHPDSEHTKNKLSWASYATIDDFLNAFNRMSPYCRSLYEILPTSRAMPLIFDCEWVVPLNLATTGGNANTTSANAEAAVVAAAGVVVEDPQVATERDRQIKMERLCQHLSQALKANLPQVTKTTTSAVKNVLPVTMNDFVVITAHRRVSKKDSAATSFKNSFHLIHRTIGFEDVDAHKEFVLKKLLPKLLADPVCCWNKPDKRAPGGTKLASIIDETIYTKNRAFRTPGSCKAGGSPAMDSFRIVSGHTMKQALVSSYHPEAAFTITMARLRGTMQMYFQPQSQVAAAAVSVPSAAATVTVSMNVNVVGGSSERERASLKRPCPAVVQKWMEDEEEVEAERAMRSSDCIGAGSGVGGLATKRAKL